MTCLCSSVNGDLRRRSTELRRSVPDLANDAISELFQAAADATEEAIYNSLFMATTVRSRDGTVEALPVAEVLKLSGAGHPDPGPQYREIVKPYADHFSRVAADCAARRSRYPPELFRYLASLAPSCASHGIVPPEPVRPPSPWPTGLSG